MSTVLRGKSTTRLVVVHYYKVIGNEICTKSDRIVLIKVPHLHIVLVIELFHLRIFILQ